MNAAATETIAPPLCWMDGRIAPANEARVPVLDHGLLYGDGVFEGIRFHRRRPFALDAHLERLECSARAIGLTVPMSRPDIVHAVAALIAAFGDDDGYLRLVVTRGDGALGLDPRSCPTPRLFVVAGALRLVDAATRERGVRVIIAATRRLPPDGLDPRIKSLNYLNHLLARIEANAAGADEAILLNAVGRVAEGTADNIFIVRDGVLRTPPPIDGALAGITRAHVMALAQDASMTVAETSLAPFDLYTCDECFLTGTGAELIPVASIDGRAPTHCPGPVFRCLRDAYHAAVRA